MNVGFIVYPKEQMTPQSDCTLRMIHECVTRGHRLAITTDVNLTIRFGHLDTPEAERLDEPRIISTCGLREVFGLWRDEAGLSLLLIGKCSIASCDILEELSQRGLLHPLEYIPIPFQNPSPERNNPIFDYTVSGIK